MRELHFTRVGKINLAEEGNYRFVIRALDPDVAINRWIAEVHKRSTKTLKSPIAKQACPTKAVALEFLAKYRTPEAA